MAGWVGAFLAVLVLAMVALFWWPAVQCLKYETTVSVTRWGSEAHKVCVQWVPRS